MKAEIKPGLAALAHSDLDAEFTSREFHSVCFQLQSHCPSYSKRVLSMLRSAGYVEMKTKARANYPATYREARVTA